MKESTEKENSTPTQSLPEDVDNIQEADTDTTDFVVESEQKKMKQL